MIDLQNVSKTYTVKQVQKTILDDVSFTFESGQNVALMGHNGAGKSTVMRLIAGIEPATSGRIRRSEKVSWPLGFSAGFNGLMTGVDNVRFVARIYGVKNRAGSGCGRGVLRTWLIARLADLDLFQRHEGAACL